MPRSIAHIITGLETGGAETMLVNLLAKTDRARWLPWVVSLQDRGTLATEIERLGVAVATLGLGRTWPNPVAALRVRRLLGSQSPAVLVGWMYHGNLAALLSAVSLGRRIPVVWDIQYTPDALRHEKRLTGVMIRLGARFSRYPRRIIYNSRVSATRHSELGYDATRAVVIPNGFDTQTFAPSPAAREAWRARLGLTADHVLIGRIARYHVMKDFTGFLKAAASLIRERPFVRFVLAGRGVDARNAELVSEVRTRGLGDVVSLLGEVRPPNELNAALDIACSSSAYGEAFPGVLAEAMACGVPCVTTDVGDSAWIVGEIGSIVRPRDPAALAAALRFLVDVGPDQRRLQGAQARARIRDNFSIEKVAGQYEEVFAEVAT